MNHKLAPLTGVVFVALLVAGIAVNGSTPGSGDSATKVLAYYQAHHQRIAISAALTVLAVFYGVLRDYLRRSEGVMGLTATAFGGVILFAASGGLSAGANFALADAPGHLTPATAQTLNLFNVDVSAGLSNAGLAIMLLMFGLAILQSPLLPRWLGWAAFPIGLVALVSPIAWAAFILGALWTLVVSIAMWRRGARSETVVA
jgi:hypothetical protein